MFYRNIIDYLKKWKQKKHRKPLIVRGARQVGKTVAVKMFSKENFSNMIYLNLDKDDHLEIFQRVLLMTDLLQLIELKAGKKIIPGETLLFIDEIQNSSIAMTQLRYFYEEMPKLHVIAAGSLLEVKIKIDGFSFPVGRVEYCYMYPVTFDEFLSALGEYDLLEYINNIDLNSILPKEIHDLIFKKFIEYSIIGGMPEAVAQYTDSRSFIDIDSIYESIIIGYKDDVNKYSSEAKSVYIQHVIEHCAKYIGNPIKYEKFGESNFNSREMKNAFDVLEKAMVLTRIYPSASNKIPMIKNLRKSPKLFFLDMGLVNYQNGLRETLFNNRDLNSIYQGQIAEQIVGQMLLSLSVSQSHEVAYWYRDKKGATSEVDFLITYLNRLIPIEVKSGQTGRLKSLHQFIKESNSKFAFRVYSGEKNIQVIELDNGIKYKLVSLPFYLVFRLYDFIEQI